MNFLQIAQRIRQEMGTGGLGPSTLLSQFGEDKQYTDWTREAYIDVLNYARDWDFLWKEIIGLVVLVGTGVIWGLLAAGVFGTAA